MLKINAMPQALTANEAARLAQLATPPVCDALNMLGVGRRLHMCAAIKPVSKSCKIMGVAYTVLATDGNSFPVHYAAYHGKAGCVLVVDSGSFEDGPYMGELMVNTARYMGINGIVIDGYVRDAELIQAMDYPVFCKGFTPVQPGKADTGEINGRINCAGVEVQPGDVIFGDLDGVVVIPRQMLAEVLELAEAKDKADMRRRELIEAFFHDNIGNNKQKDLSGIMTKETLRLISSKENNAV